MKRLLLFCLIITIGVVEVDAQNTPSVPMDSLNLMPWPAHITMQPGEFRIQSDFTITVKGNPANRIYGGATRMLRRLDRRTGLFFSQNFVTAQSDTVKNPSLVIQVTRPGKVVLGEDESYQLDVAPAGITLKAEDDIGALHGLQTILQLVQADTSGFYLPAVRIKDQPRFKWRGLMIDVSRHFEPINVIKRELDGMAFVKMNVLHLHLTDDQGFRIQSKTYPKLAEMGSDGKYFTQQQIKDIIKYANDRGIRVVPEFDLPGHSTSWFVSYPQYASAPGPYKVQDKFGIFNPVFDPTNPKTYSFLDKFIKEMANLFPDEYMHIGGDENNGVQWHNNPRIQAFMKKHNMTTTAELQTYFVQKLARIVTKYHKKVVGWDEILQPGVPQSAIIQSWRGKQSLYEAARKGHQVLLSNGYYIDLLHPAARHYENDPIPPDANLKPEVAKRILGGEATMWGELVTPLTIDSRIWPRTAAIAERLWSPDSLQNIDWMYKRLHVINLELEQIGMTQIRNQGVILRNLAGHYGIRPLKILVNVIAPLQGYRRNSNGMYTNHSPLTMIADAATADPWTALKFNERVSRFLAHPSPALEKQIRADLNMWKENNAALESIIHHSPALDQIRPIAQSLARLSNLGLQALDYYDQNKRPPDDWARDTTNVFIEARKPAGKTTLRIVNSVEKLVTLAENSQK